MTRTKMTLAQFDAWLTWLLEIEQVAHQPDATAEIRVEYERLVASKPIVETDDPEALRAIVNRASGGRIGLQVLPRSASPGG